MAFYTNQISVQPVTWFSRAQAVVQREVAKLRVGNARRQAYHATFCALSQLSNAELADIGVARSNIASLAHSEAMKITL